MTEDAYLVGLRLAGKKVVVIGGGTVAQRRVPLLIAGGPALSMNPEPLAPYFDAIVIGEIEELSSRLTDLLVDGVGSDREELLDALDGLAGV